MWQIQVIHMKQYTELIIIKQFIIHTWYIYVYLNPHDLQVPGQIPVEEDI